MYLRNTTLGGLLLLIASCSTTPTDQGDKTNELNKTNRLSEKEVSKLKEQVALHKDNLSTKQKEIELLNGELGHLRQSSNTAKNHTLPDFLLPANAKKGECYARVWMEPQYKTVKESYVAKEASDKITIKPAIYEWAEEKVLIKEASEELIPVPAKYAYKEVNVKVSDARRSWRINPWLSARLASKNTIDAAQSGGIDLDNTPINTCYHEHYIEPQYKNISQEVLEKEATEKVTTSHPIYQTVEEKVLVKEASSRVETIAATYETVSERVIDVPAHTIWKKGTGPIQKIDEATGEIMCLVEIPATYKAITKQRLRTPATTKTVEIPAQYKLIKVSKLITPAKENRTTIPASYKTITKRETAKEGKFIWHRVDDK